MRKILFFIVLIASIKQVFSQEIINRRAGYFDTYTEIKDSIDSIHVIKSTREMFVYHQQKQLKKYMISLGEESVGKKQFEGDMKTPEGLYYIDDRDTNSSYHTNLNISYPNEVDSIFAATQSKSAGGDIKIHGFPNNHKKYQEKDFLNTDWTIGCIAISDFEVDELYKWVIVNCPIFIAP